MPRVLATDSVKWTGEGVAAVVAETPEQAADAIVLPIREAECAMERRFRHAAQGASLSTGSDVGMVDTEPR